MNSISPDDVSCVIPYAGAQCYIGEVLRSAVEQRFHEIIIVNDGCDPGQLAEAARQPQVRIIHLPQSVGCPNARNVGIKACLTPYVVMLDHDDLLREGYLPAMISWVTQHGLRCAAATLRYIGENPARVGALVSRHPDFFMPSGFFSEISLLSEVGYFPDSCGDDFLLFRSIRQVTKLMTCPDAGVLYRIHPQAESSRNTRLWWAFSRLFPLYEQGDLTLAEVNRVAREFAANGAIPGGMESRLSGLGEANARFLARSLYACWLNRDLPGFLRYGVKLLRYLPDSLRLALLKWRKAEN